MDPVSLILGAASLAGGLLGGRRKHIDPEWLKQHFGPGAVSQEALELFNNLINSPHGQSIMANAAEQGQQFARDTNRQAAMAGLAGPEANSGAGIFATSAAQGASDSFQRDVRGQFYQMALPLAQQMVNQRMQAYLNDMQQGGYQTPGSAMWQKFGEAAGTVGAMLPQKTVETPMPEMQVDRSKLPMPPTTPVVYQPTSKMPNVNPMLPPINQLKFQSALGAVRPIRQPMFGV